MAALHGKTFVITGANSGIGKHIALGLAKLGAHLILGCRDPHRAEQARDEIAAASNNSALEVLKLDVSSLASVRLFAAAITVQRLDGLINNAGAWFTHLSESVDAIELQWATNVLGPQALTLALLPALKAAPEARIVNVASGLAGGLVLDDLEVKRGKYPGFDVYKRCKQAQRMLTWSLAEQLEQSKVTANAMAPGFTHTELNRSAKGFLRLVIALSTPFALTPEKAADTAIWLASDPSLATVSGKFFEKRKEIPCQFRDPGARQKLWAECEARLASIVAA